MRLILNNDDLKNLRDEEVKKEIDNLPYKSHEELIALAKVGLNAVIDEATGYQEERFKIPNSLKNMKEKLIKEAESE
jgi:ribosomal protein L5